MSVGGAEWNPDVHELADLVARLRDTTELVMNSDAQDAADALELLSGRLAELHKVNAWRADWMERAAEVMRHGGTMADLVSEHYNFGEG